MRWAGAAPMICSTGERPEGTRGTKAECLARIKQIWTDMRPLSLRRKMEEMERAQGNGTSGNG